MESGSVDTILVLFQPPATTINVGSVVTHSDPHRSADFEVAALRSRPEMSFGIAIHKILWRRRTQTGVIELTVAYVALESIHLRHVEKGDKKNRSYHGPTERHRPGHHICNWVGQSGRMKFDSGTVRLKGRLGLRREISQLVSQAFIKAVDISWELGRIAWFHNPLR